jgi:hypothetical protein
LQEGSWDSEKYSCAMGGGGGTSGGCCAAEDGLLLLLLLPVPPLPDLWEGGGGRDLGGPGGPLGGPAGGGGLFIVMYEVSY